MWFQVCSAEAMQKNVEEQVEQGTQLHHSVTAPTSEGTREVTLSDVMLELKSLRKTVTTKSDVSTLKTELTADLEALVSTRLAPLQGQLADLDVKHTALAAQYKQLKARLDEGGAPQASSWKDRDRNDPARKQVAVLG